MDIKTWLARQTAECPKMERLKLVGLAYDNAEMFYGHIIEGIDGEFQGEYLRLTKVLIAKFKGQGGRFRQAYRFKTVPPMSNHASVVLPFVRRERAVALPTWEAKWISIYADLLGIEIDEKPAVINAEIIRQERRSA